MKRQQILAAVLLPLMLPGVALAQTLESIYDRKFVLEDEQVGGDADTRALRAYEDYLRQNPSDSKAAPAKKRLADLRMRKLLKAQDEGISNQVELQSNYAAMREVIALYQSILTQHPGFEETDDVLYQMAQACLIVGENDIRFKSLQTLVKNYPDSKYYDESQFRLGEIYFVQEKYTEALKAYKEVIKRGEGSGLYNQGLFKAGWSQFKRAEYEESLDLLLILMGTGGTGAHLDADGKMTAKSPQYLEDTLRIMALNFYYLDGVDAADKFLLANDSLRPYEALVYDRLAKLYLEKGVVLEAAQTYESYLARNPFTREAPKIQQKIIAFYDEGGDTNEVLQQKAKYVRAYALDGEFWVHNNLRDLPEAVDTLEKTIVELAEHYHASWQETSKPEEFEQAVTWYAEYLESFKEDSKAQKMSFQLAELLYENQKFHEAFKQFEETAYSYGRHPLSADAGFASLQAHEEYVKGLSDEDSIAESTVTSVNSYLKFAYTFPQHKEAPNVVKTAAQRLYDVEDYEQSADVAQMYVERYKDVNSDERSAVWLLLATANMKAGSLEQAEQAYNEVMGLTDPSDERHQNALNQLAMMIYQQGAEAQEEGDYETAAAAFMRVKQKAPNSDLAVTAEYDAATMYAKMEDYTNSVKALESLRSSHPNNPYAHDIVRKLAAMYEKERQYAKAAEEYLTIGRTDEKQDTQREATMKAGRMFDKADMKEQSLAVYREFTDRFKEPVDEVIEVMNDIAQVYNKNGNKSEYYAMLKKIILADSQAGAARNNRTKYLAAKATAGIAAPRREAYEQQALTLPLESSLAKKQQLFQSAVEAYELANTYGVSEITTESSYHVGNIYYDFSKALMDSERPKGLSELELEQYAVLLEDQAYPFEEQAITLLEANAQRLQQHGTYDQWIKKSITQLGKLLPFKYNRPERKHDLIVLP